MRRNILWIVAILAFAACKKDDKDKVIELKEDTRYTFEVTIKGLWSENTHPQDFPTDAKFGKVVALSHHKKNMLFRKGNKAESWMNSYFGNDNIEAFTSFGKEYQERNKVEAALTVEGFGATEERKFEFNTTGKHPRFSMLVKLSPSPDWFIALNNANLNNLALGGSNSYIVSVYDAGLQSGKTYKEKGYATNEAIEPKIGPPLNYPKGGINKLAIVTISYKTSKKNHNS